MATPTRLEAPAKLTLSLHIVGRRDDGYHRLAAEMVSVDLVDTLEVSAGQGLSISGAGADQLADEGANLVNRALALVGRRASVRLHKRIPPGAGLGGGSSDAAAVLRWAGFWDLTRAAELGGDVPFCLVGGRARVGGIGEHIEPLAFVRRTFTLLCPPLMIETAEVYRRWDELGGPTGAGANDLEAAALAVEPRLGLYREALAEVSGATPQLAGSGGTWFVEGAFPGKDRLVVHTLPGSEAVPPYLRARR
jgi:4-diphosphocytidyl-2-C-methyl-D-erythritol kinase